jgi:hypothetical protein
VPTPTDKDKDRERLAKIIGAFPEAEATSATGQHMAYSIRGKKFAYHLVDHHGDGRVSFECKAPPGENGALVASDPGRFYLPKYMAHHGWVGLYLDLGDIDWAEIGELATDAYLLAAPKRLAKVIADQRR